MAACPKCQQVTPVHDRRSSRTWRHLNIMQFETHLSCRIPRIKCPEHGILSIPVPWADIRSRFTLLFEGFAVELLEVARSVEEARKLLGVNWHQLEDIKRKAVARGLKRRSNAAIPYLGIDEKQFKRGHSYVSALVDLVGGRVLEVVEDRREENARELLEKALSQSQKEGVKAVALDMWQAFANAVSKVIPQAEIVHDRFHVSKHLNEAVDKVRRKENRELQKKGDSSLKGSRYLWLYNEENIREEFKEKFNKLKSCDLKVSRAWAIKELWRDFWECSNEEWALKHFKKWYSWAIRSRLEPIKKVARMIKGHLQELLNYFKYHISNAMAEGLNSKIQTIKSNARGYRSFESYRTSILFYCGGLNMKPVISH